MKYSLAILLIFFLHLLQAQYSWKIDTYPALVHQVQADRFNWKPIDSLLEIQQPRKALSLLENVEKELIKNKNIVGYFHYLNRLNSCYYSGQYEGSELEKMVWLQHEKLANLPSPYKNFLSEQLYHWFSQLAGNNFVQTDETSLLWTVDGKKQKVQNNDVSWMYNYYLQQILANPTTLMEIDPSGFNQTKDSLVVISEFDGYTTLFEYFAERYIHYASELVDFTESTYYGLTDELPRDPQFYTLEHKIIQLYYHLEKLNIIQKRWKAYAYHVLNRLQYVQNYSSVADNEALLQEAYNRFEAFLSFNQHSILFSLKGIENDIQQGIEYDWKTNVSVQNLLYQSWQKLSSLQSKFPKNDYTKELESLKEQLQTSELSFQMKSSLEQGKSSLLNVKYRNVNTAELIVYHIEKETINNDETNQLKRYQLKEIGSYSLHFQKDSLLNFHTKDFILPPFNASGSYLYMIGKDRDQVQKALKIDTLAKVKDICFQKITCTDLMVSVTKHLDQLMVLVTDRKTGKPIQDATIELITKYYQPEAMIPFGGENPNILKTNKKGIALFKKSPINNVSVKVNYRSDSTIFSNYFYNQYTAEEQTSIKLFTDREIYRPGQVVYYKALVYKGKYNKHAIQSNFATTIELKDRNGKVVFSTAQTTNEFGSAHGDFTLPLVGFSQGSLNFYINHQYVSNIQVEAYKIPTFEVKLDELTSKVTLQDTVHITGKVVAFAGYPIQQAQVKLSIRQYVYGNTKRNYYGEENEIADTTIELRTDAAGKFDMRLFPYQGAAIRQIRFTCSATVTDGTGETHEAESNFTLGNESYRLSIDDLGNDFAHLTKQFSFTISNSQSIVQKGKTVHFKVNLNEPMPWRANQFEVAEYQNFTHSEFAKAFPNADYGSIINENKKLEYEGEMNSDSLFLFNTLKLPTGDYTLEAYWIDENKDTISDEIRFNWIDLKDKKGTLSNAFFVAADHPSGKVGTKIQIYVSSNHHGSTPLFIQYKRPLEANAQIKWTRFNRCKFFTYTLTKEDVLGQSIYFRTVINGEVYSSEIQLKTLDESKTIAVNLVTKRDYLTPGTKEKWQVAIQNNPSQPVELLASMYNQALDQIYPSNWYLNPTNYPYFDNYYRNNEVTQLGWSANEWQHSFYFPSYSLNPFYSTQLGGYGRGYGRGSGLTYKNYDWGSDKMSYSIANEAIARMPIQHETAINAIEDSTNNSSKKQIIIRSNFKETAFFYPTIYIDTTGKYQFEFTVPDDLTRWKFRALAHTKDLKVGSTTFEVETKKLIMVQANAPRFFRENDSVVFSAKVVNQSDKVQQVNVQLVLKDPFTLNTISEVFGSLLPQQIEIAPNQTQEVFWKLYIPENVTKAVVYTLTASGKEHSDGEERLIPIITNKAAVTLAKNFVQVEQGTKAYFIESAATLPKSAKIEQISVQLQTQPLWTTLMSLPYLMEYPYECAEQTFARYFANRLAQTILAQNPIFKKIIETWKTADPSAFTSELAKHPELKAILLAETPWALAAQDETQKRLHLAQLFDDQQLAANIEQAFSKLKTLQNQSGSWGWFSSSYPNVYITQYIVAGFSQLKSLGIQLTDEVIVNSALSYLNTIYLNEYQHLTKEQKARGEGLNELVIHWLYATQLYAQETDVQIKEMRAYYMNELASHWTKYSIATQALIGMIAYQNKATQLVNKIKTSLIDRHTYHPNFGMYWNENSTGYGWNQQAIETQAQLIRFFQLTNQNHESDEFISRMQLWLLQQKQVQAWETTKATTLACTALFANSNLSESQVKQAVSIQIGDQPIQQLDRSSESYFTFTGTDAKLANTTVAVQTTTSSPVLGAIYLQYTAPVESIISNQSGMRVERHYYQVIQGQEVEISANTAIEIGSTIKVKLQVQASQSMDFVHLRDSKAAGFEPTAQLSGYMYNGIGYFISNSDASTEFFIDYLPKGNYTFEYTLFATEKGKLHVGPAEISCMYAPSYRANSKGFTFQVK